jgi:hypothetical protein
MGNLSAAQIQQYAANAGFSGADLAVAVAIALAESGGNPSVVGDMSLAPSNGPSYGLWQINTGTSAHPEYAGVNLSDPQTNANAAFAIYAARGGSFTEWTTYTSGVYGMYMQPLAGSPVPVQSVSVTSPFTPSTSVMTLLPSIPATISPSTTDYSTIAIALALILGVGFAISEM